MVMMNSANCPGDRRKDEPGAVHPPVIVGVGVVLGSFERVAAQVEQQRRAKFDKWLPPQVPWSVPGSP